MRGLLAGETEAESEKFFHDLKDLTSDRWPRNSPVYGVMLMGELLGNRTLESAATRVARRMDVAAGTAFAYGLLRSESTRRTGWMVQGIVAVRRRLPVLAWESFLEAGLAEVITVAPAELAEAGLRTDPERAVPLVMDWLLDGDRPADPAGEAKVIECLLSYRHLAEARAGYAAIQERAQHQPLPPGPAAKLAWLAQWAAPQPDPEPAAPGEVVFGVIDYKAPDRNWTSANLGDYVQTIAALGHLLRHQDVTLTDGPDSALVEAARRLQGQIASHYRAAESAAGRVRLVAVNRDASLLQTVPSPTWMLAFGWYSHRSTRSAYQFPLNPDLRPVFISFHVDNLDMLNEETLDYLRRYGPVGCRDWATVWLLLGAGVPAFFSGCITTTVGGYWERDLPPAGTGRVGYVDVPARADGEPRAQAGAIYRDRPIAWNLGAAHDVLDDYRRNFDRIETSRLHCYLPMSSIGVESTLTVAGRGDLRFDGLRNLGVTGARAMGERITALLEPVMRLIISGADESTVYSTWQELTAPLVEVARAAFEAPLEPIEPPFDVHRAVAEATGGRVAPGVAVERFAPGRLDLVVGFDQGFLEPAKVSLTSMVDNCSRPIRLHVLARGIADDVRDGFQRTFPEVEFHWYDMSAIDYGPIKGMLEHISVATMDRLLIPLLLPTVDKVVYADLDTVTEGDLSELADLDLLGNPIAARSAVSDKDSSILGNLAKTAKGLRGDHVRFDEFLRRVGRELGRDAVAFNAGVLVLDLRMMRETGFVEHYLGYAPRYGLHDQGLLNFWAGSRRTPLPPAWNVYADQEYVREPKLVHYAGSRKPWVLDMGPVGKWWAKWDAAYRARAARLG